MTAATTAAAKKATATKSSTRAKVDVIASLVNTIENYKEDEAHKALLKTNEQRECDAFTLGGILSLIQRNGWLKGYASLKEYIATEYGMEYRKAMYYIAIYNDLNDSGVEWADVKSLGWTKLSRLSKVMTKENAAEWVAKAKSMTVLQLEQAIKGNQASDAPKDTDQPTSTVEPMNFKLHTDQKVTVKEALAKAKAELHTDVDSVALENICMGYLTGAVSTAKPEIEAGDIDADKLVAIFKALTPDAVLEAFGTVWPNIDVTVSE